MQLHRPTMKPVSPTQAWRDLAYIVATTAALIGLNNFQSCGGVRTHAAKSMSGDAAKNDRLLQTVVASPADVNNQPARLETLPRVHLRETPPTLRQVESPEIVKL